MLQKYYQCIVLCLVFNVYTHSLESLQEGAFPRSSPDGLNWYREVHPPVAAPSGGVRMKRVCQEDAQPAFACLPFPLVVKVICPDVAAAIGSFTDSRTNVPKLSPWNRDQRLFRSLPGSSQVGTTEISHLVDRIMDHTPSFCLFWDSSDCWGLDPRTKDQVLRGSEVTWLSLLEAPLRDFDGMQ